MDNRFVGVIDEVTFYGFAMASGDVPGSGTTPQNPGCSQVTCAGLTAAYGQWPIDNTCTDTDSVEVCGETDAGNRYVTCAAYVTTVYLR